MISRTGKGGFYPALFLFLTIFSLSIFKISSYDLWWHLKAGEMIVGGGFKPAPTNVFSLTEPDHPWINFSWLFDVIVYFIHKAAGFNGLIIFQAVVGTAVFYFIYKTAVLTPPPPLFSKEGAGGRYGIFVLLLIAYFAARFRFSLRPHLLALLFFSIDIYLLKRFTLSHRERAPLIAIPLLQILWANVHGSAIIGVLLPVLFLIGNILNPPQSPFNKGGRKGDFFLILLLTIAASLINPYGYTILTDPFTPFFGEGAELFNALAIDEWQMPPKDMFFGWYGLLLVIGVLSFLPSLPHPSPLPEGEGEGEKDRVRGNWTDLLLFSTFAILSIKAVRFIDLFAVAAAPVIYKNVVSGQGAVVRNENTIKNSTSSLITHHSSLFLILALFWLIAIKDATFTLGLGVDDEVIPKKAVEFIERNGIQGRIFNSYNFGGYLIYKGYPVFIDGRLCYSNDFINEFADANLSSPHPAHLPKGERVEARGWKKVDEKYRPDIVLVGYDKPAIPETLLIDKKKWALVYWDDLTMLFLRRSEHFSGIISKNEYYLNPMDMYGLLPSPQPSPRGRGSEGAGVSHSLIPSPLWGEGQGEGRVFAEAQRRVKEGPESMRAHLLLGNLYMSRGEADKSIVEYETVIKSFLSFGKAEAHNNLGTVYERVGDAYSAGEEYKEAIRLDSVYPLPERNLGYLKLGQYQNVEALWHLNKYIQLGKGDRKTWAIVSDLKGYRDTLILRIFIGGGAMIGILWIAARRFNRRGTVPI